MSITSVVNDLVTSVSVINALKPLPPTISGYSVAGKDDLALDPAGGQTVQINGTGFLPGATITFDGSAVAVVTFVNANQLTFTSPAKTAGTYTIYAVNPDGGTAIYIPGIIYSVLPTWTTSAGTLGSYYETTSISNTVVASGDAPITYSLFSGSLPTGATLAANGVITGIAPVDSSSTTYSFTIQASDAQLQDSTRSFSLTINVDAVTWVSPANNTTYTSTANSAIANVALSATDAAGYSVSYSANALPTGLTLTGSNIAGTPTVVADSSTLLTATAATTNRTAVRTINWSITVANDPYFMYNSLLLPGNGTNGAQNNTFLDSSTNAFSITRNGNTTQGTFTPYGSNWSNFTSSGSNYLSCNPGATAAFGTGDFTVEAFVFATSALSSGDNPYICDTRGGGGAWLFSWNPSGGSNPWELAWNNSAQLQSTTSMVINQWNHCAYVRSGTTGTLYLNGVSIGTWTDSYNYSASVSSMTIARRYTLSSGTQFLPGYLSNLRIVKGTAVYTGAFTPSTTPLTAITNTVLLTCQSNRFVDNSASPLTLTVNGSPSVQRFSPFSPTTAYSTSVIGGSGYFDGSGDYLTAAQNAAFNFGTGAFTVEAWVYLTAYPSGGEFTSILSLGNGATAGSIYTGWGLLFTNASISFYRYDGSTETNNSAATAIPLNTWSHVVAVRNGSSSLSIYLNGTRILNTTSSVAYNNVNSNNLNVGYWRSGASPTDRFLTGYISNGRIVNGTAVYNPTSATLTVPTAPVTAITNTSLLLNYTNAGILDNAMMNDLETVGNAQISTSVKKYGTGSMYFDGTSSNRIKPPASSLYAFGTGNFTVEAWIYVNSLVPENFVFDTRSSASTAGMGFSIEPSTGKLRYSGSANNVLTSTSVSTGVWTHVAWVRNNGTLAGYINGVSGGSVSNSDNLTQTNGEVGNVPFSSVSTNMYIDDLRITKGYARYTTTFTPPTSAFPIY